MSGHPLRRLYERLVDWCVPAKALRRPTGQDTRQFHWDLIRIRLRKDHRCDR